MGVFDFLKKKNKGIDDVKFNSQQFQNEVCALTIWQLEENNDNPDRAISELKKVGLNDIQIELILKKANQFLVAKRENYLSQPGIEEALFNSDAFQNKTLDKVYQVYFEQEQRYDAVLKELLDQGFNYSQANAIVEKLKKRISASIDDFQAQLDSGAISEIKVRPNPEHVKENADADTVDKYIGFGAFQMNRGDLENALELFDKAIELNEKATLAYANKGVLYSKKGAFDQALECYNKALEIEPDHVGILENKMNLQFELLNENNENEFITTVKTILKYDPIHPNALIYIVQYYLKENDLQNALQSVKRLFADFHREDSAIQLLLNVFGSLPTDVALNEFSVYKNEINDEAKYQLDYCKGLYFMGLQRYDDAIVTFEKLNKWQEFSWNYYQMAISKNFQNKTDECLALLKKTFELEPELKEDARQVSFLQNLATNSVFMELTK